MNTDTTATPPAAPPADTLDSDTVPTSFGVFKPVGHVMVGLPAQAPVEPLVKALRQAGWPAASLLRFEPGETVAELEAMVGQAGNMAGFGFEIVLLRRYLALAHEGHRWLLVRVDDADHAAAAAALARSNGATLAVHYRTLTVEELI